MGKTVPESKFTELKGLDRISQIVHEMKCLFREISKDDFGINGEIEVVVPKASGKGFETTGGFIKVQAKSGMSYVKNDSTATFTTPVKKNDLEDWSECKYPVYFIVYHPADDCLYFKEVRSYVRTAKNVFQPPLKIEFNKATDQFTAASRNAVCEHAAVSPSRISFESQERLFCNLLPVKTLPRTLTCSTTRRKSHKSVNDEIDGPSPPFCVTEGKIYTLSDLRNPENVLRPFIGKKIDEVDAGMWFNDPTRHRDVSFLMSQLLGHHRRRCRIRFNPDFGRFGRAFFPRENEKDLEFKRGWTSIRTGKLAPARITAKRYEYGKFSFWRHLAAELSFLSFGDKWFLRINPKYFFTDDGKNPCTNDLVGPYTTMLKAKEHNIQVLNHVLFWADVLSQNQPAIRMQIDNRTIVEVEKTPHLGIASFAIPEDPATFEEVPQSGQLSLFTFDDQREEISDEY